MKLFLMTLLAMGLPPWIHSALGQSDEGVSKDRSNVDVVVTVGQTVGDDDVKHKVVKIRAKTVGDAKDGRRDRNVVIVDNASGLGDDERGWLGISIDTVSKVLSKQLDLDGRGILIEHVAKDSPADKAGLEDDDIILEIDGQPVEGGADSAVNLLKGTKAGDEIEIVILRNGKEKVITATLGSHEDVAGAFHFTWKSGDEPNGEVIENIHTHGKLLKRGPGGEWIFKDLGDLGDQLKDLPRHIRMMIPKSGQTQTQVYVLEGDKVIKTTVKHDGESLTVTREGEGPITVTRVDADGNQSTHTYDTLDDLEAGDDEASELFEQAGKKITIDLNVDGQDADEGDFDIDFNFDTDQWQQQAEKWKEAAEEWREQMETGLGSAQEAYQKAMKELQKHMEELSQNGQFDFKAMPFFFSRDGKGGGLPFSMAFGALGKPKHSFELLADGTIEVTIRKGDGELVQRFEDEDDLADRRPDLFQQYQDLMELDGERE